MSSFENSLFKIFLAMSPSDNLSIGIPSEMLTNWVSWTAVVRGAVMHGLNSRIVKQRVLRRHYGIATSVAWNNERHPLERRWKDKLDGTWRVDVMRWYAQKVILPYNIVNRRVIVSKTIRGLRWSCITTSMTAKS
jgi:hypothetical protein